MEAKARVEQAPAGPEPGELAPEEPVPVRDRAQVQGRDQDQVQDQDRVQARDRVAPGLVRAPGRAGEV